MSIKVLFFASLREQMGKGQTEVDWEESITTAQIWQKLNDTDTQPDNVLVACNQSYCDWQTCVHDGDEVAFFPPVTGG